MRKYQSCQFWDVWIAIDYSMFQLNAFVTFSCFFFNKNAHFCQKNTFEIVQRGKKSLIFSRYLIYFHLKKFTRTNSKQISYEDLFREMLTHFIIRKSLGKTCTIFQRYHMDNFKSLAQNLRWLFWFSIETWQARRGIIREKSLDFS